MGRHSMKASDGEGFLRAFTDAWSDLEQDTDYRVYLSITRSGRMGILHLTLEAFEVSADHTGRPQAAYACDYPTAQVGTLEACLYQSMVKLERLISTLEPNPYWTK